MAKKTYLKAEIIKLEEFERFLSFLPNPEELLGDAGRSIPVYREMKLDGKIDSLLNLRKDTVIGYPWHLEKRDASEQVFSFVKEHFRPHLNWEGDLRELLSAIDYGYAVSEVIWAEEGGYWVPAALKSRKPERFRFRADGVPLLAASGEALEQPYKFLVHRNKPEAENPYGTATLSRCHWPWQFKRAGFEFWVAATEKCGVPSVLAIFECTDERLAASKAALLAASLTQISAGSGAALANVKEVKTLEMSGALADFQVLIGTCNAEISYAITGQSLATGEAEFGTRAQAEVHEDTLSRICRADAAALAHTLQTLIGWLVELNFGAGTPAPVGAFDLSNRASFQEVMSAVERGVPVSRRLLYDRYGLPEPAGEEDAFLAAPSSSPLSLADRLKKKPLFR